MKFQSLKGILRNLENDTEFYELSELRVSIPKRDFTEFRAWESFNLAVNELQFQSLKGILRNLEKKMKNLILLSSLFQSLKGILRNLEASAVGQSQVGGVSIPKRDFTEFRAPIRV